MRYPEEASFWRYGASYRIRISCLGERMYYWHLYHNGERINGGLAETWLDALHGAQHAVAQHDYWTTVTGDYQDYGLPVTDSL